VKRKWTYGNTAKRGRPPTPAVTVELIVRFARENRAWGYGKLQGELRKMGHRGSRATIRRVLRRRALPPVPRRGRTTWRAFVTQRRDQLLACDCFTVDALFLQRPYVLFFIELGSRRPHLAGCTATPDAAWVTQQARQLVLLGCAGMIEHLATAAKPKRESRDVWGDHRPNRTLVKASHACTAAGKGGVATRSTRRPRS
jgi:hypothetical protein